jgi:5,10-methylenetetrahydromethanopterin reductase
MATLQAEFGARVELAIGRGDSALAHIGCAPASVAHFAAYLRAVQGYLSGEEVEFDRRFVADGVSPVDALRLGTAPPASRLRWLRAEAAKVPVHVAATGPKVIDLAATLGDGVAFAVGADPERIGWAVDRAKQARRDAGLNLDGLELAVWLNIAVHPDLDVARSLVGGGLASFSRFSVIHGSPAGGASTADATVLTDLHRSYDMTEHGNRAVSHTAVLTEDFIERNAVIGGPERCIERLRALSELGITRFLLMEAFSRDGEAGVAHRNLVRDVLPELRA